MFRNKRKGIATRTLSAILTIALTVSLCPGEMAYVRAEEIVENDTGDGTEKISEELVFDVTEVSVPYGTTLTKTASGAGGEATSYVSSDPLIATVDNNGVVTPVSLGEVTITANREESEDYQAATGSYKVTVVQGTQEALVWKNEIPTDLTWKDIYENTVSGGSGNGVVTYTSSNTEIAEVDSATGILTLKKPGEVTITATKSGAGLYADISNQYTLDIQKAQQTPLVFAEKNPDVIYVGDTYQNIATGGSVEGSVEYQSISTDVATITQDGTISGLAQGTARIKAILAGNDYYEDAIATYQVPVYPESMKTSFTFQKGTVGATIGIGETYTNAIRNSASTVTYTSADTAIATVDNAGTVTGIGVGTVVISATDGTTTLTYAVKVTANGQEVVFENGNSSVPMIGIGETYTNKATAATTITYTSSDESVATVDENGVVTGVKTGSVTITATAAEENGYSSVSAKYALRVGQMTQTITFEKQDIQTVKFNENDNKYSNKASTSATDATDITAEYSVDSGSNFVTNFDTATGSFDIIGAGTIVIRAAFNGNAKYQSGTATYTLIVEKAEQEIEFASTAYTIKTGEDFKSPKASEKGDKYGTGAISYEVLEDKNGIIQSFDTTNGEITLNGKTGTATIKASKAEDDNYNSAFATYTVTVEEWSAGDDAYTITDGTLTGDVWFCGEVSIEANDGYEISTDGINWKAKLENVVTEDTTGEEVSFYIKEKTHGYVSTVLTKIIKKDSVKPAANIVSTSVSLWEKLLTFFGIKHTESYTVDFSDITSGVQSVQYYVEYFNSEKEKNIAIKTDDELDEITGWSNYTAPFEMDKDKIYVVYAKVQDNAEHYVYASTNGIVHDTTAPVIDFNVTTKGAANDAGGIYSGDIALEIQVTDYAPYSGVKSLTWEVFCDGAATPTQSGNVVAEELDNPSYGELENIVSKEITIKADKNVGDEIVLKVTAEDFSGNTATKQETYVIDTTAPTIEMTYNDNNVPYQTIGDTEYYTGEKEVKIVITERTNTFSNEDAIDSITIEAKDINGNIVAIDKNAMISGFSTVEGNTDEEDTHTATISFTQDAAYQVSINYVNKLAQEGKAPKELSFVIDNVTPTASLDVKSEGFGNIYAGNIDVDINVSDGGVSSGIDTIKYEVLCDNQMTQNDTIKPSEAVSTYTESIIIDKDLNQGDKIVLKVYVTDRCGKTYEDEAEYVINSSEPTIEVNYDNNNVYNLVGEKGYFTENRTATVVITERSNLFNEEKATAGIRIEAKDANGNAVALSDTMISDWTTTKGQTADKDMHTATISFTEDANYTVSIGYTNDLKQKAEVLKTNAVAPYLFAIDSVAPKIDITYTDSDSKPIIDGEKGYFKGERIATIIITEATTFEAKDVNITVTSQDSKKKDVDNAAIISEFSKTASNTYMATINFQKDANYTFDIHYVDKAGHEAIIKTITKDSAGIEAEAAAPYKFAVDITAPTGEIKIKEDWSWDKFLETITFGVYNSNQPEKVTIESFDATSGVKSVHYYRTTNGETMTLDELKAVDERSWVKYEAFELSPNSKIVIYARIIDNADHIIYLSSDGIVLDDKAPVVEKAEPVVKISAGQGTDVVYNGNVAVAVNVTEPKEDSVFSGIKTIEYTVSSRGIETQSGILYQGDEKVSNFVESWASTDTDSKTFIVVDAAKNNSNSVVVEVRASDYAGNIGVATLNLKIDISAPQITVTYDNNEGDASFGDAAYFKEGRTATIIVKDNNFDPSKVSISTGGATAVGWTSTVANENGDDGIHRTSISFAADGEYTFGIFCTDKAGNSSDRVDYGNSVSPTKFTIDGTAPEGSVTYDNNNAVNDNYYNDQRIATIQVKERNFELSRVALSLTATDDGQNAEVPSISNWVSNGDIHTATIVYDKDALYTFDFDYQDKAGNKAADIPEETFYIDRTNPTVSISKISDETAYSDEGNIGFVITATDTNFDVFTPVLTAVVKEGDNFVTKEISGGVISNIGNGQTYTVKNVDADGIYRIACTVVDKAGNAYTEVQLENADGETYLEQRAGADTLLTFSVNRQGSVFELGEGTIEIVKQYYVQNVYEDVVVVEINTNALKEYKVTLNGKELVEGKDYTVTTEGGQGEWMKYIYAIEKSLFEAEGQYQIVVSSKDEADNDAFSDVKDATVTFIVDRTAPVVTVTGLETNGRYQVERQTVTLIPTDDGGALNSLLVRTVDEDGKELVRLVDLSGEELTNALDENDGKITFDIEEGLYQNVQIICNDCAIDNTGNTNTYNMTFYQVSVSSSAVKMLFASKGMRYGIIAGIILIVGGVLLLVFRRKKSNK